MLLPAKRVVLSLLALFLAFSSPQAQEKEPNRNIRFGMPAPAKAVPESREAYLIARPQYVLSYNAKTRTPNWVSWQLRNEDIGNAAQSAFEQDPALPKGVIARVATKDYSGGGFDRGHGQGLHAV
jgi:endonuclease G